MVSSVVVLPDRLALDRWTPFAQLMAFRPWLTTVALGLGGGLLSRHRARPAAGALLALGLVSAAAWLPRAIARGEPVAGGADLSVLSCNVYRGRADVGALAQVIRDCCPDLVALPEAGHAFRVRLDRELSGLGYRSWSSHGPRVPDHEAVTVFAAPWAGMVLATVGTQTTVPSLEITGGALGSLRFVAMHARAPVWGATGCWRRDLALLRQWSSSGHTVVAGDLNATLDQSVLRAAMRDYTDAASQRGRGWIGTWPTAWPRWLAIPIDHILTTRDIHARQVEVLDIPGSDHRALLAQLHVYGERRTYSAGECSSTASITQVW